MPHRRCFQFHPFIICSFQLRAKFALKVWIHKYNMFFLHDSFCNVSVAFSFMRDRSLTTQQSCRFSCRMWLSKEGKTFRKEVLVWKSQHVLQEIPERKAFSQMGLPNDQRFLSCDEAPRNRKVLSEPRSGVGTMKQTTGCTNAFKF